MEAGAHFSNEAGQGTIVSDIEITQNLSPICMVPPLLPRRIRSSLSEFLARNLSLLGKMKRFRLWRYRNHTTTPCVSAK